MGGKLAGHESGETEPPAFGYIVGKILFGDIHHRGACLIALASQRTLASFPHRLQEVANEQGLERGGGAFDAFRAVGRSIVLRSVCSGNFVYSHWSNHFQVRLDCASLLEVLENRDDVARGGPDRGQRFDQILYCGSAL